MREALTYSFSNIDPQELFLGYINLKPHPQNILICSNFSISVS
jgi:hypothetical protein